MIALLCSLTLAAQLAAGAQTPPVISNRVEVILFSDFQCSFCARVAKPFRDLQSNGAEGVQLTVQFKHFPLNIHPSAPLAHQAALAAGEQGKFWEMHDLLFANQSAVKPDDLIQYAVKLGLDIKRFNDDLYSERLKQRIAADIAEGQRLGVSGTPTFFINNKSYSGAMSFEQLRGLVLREEQRLRALSEVPDNLLSLGHADAPVTVELFADLQSPISRLAIEVIDQAFLKYPGQIKLQFRNFPLAFHPQAPLAHEAAMIAATQGRFWEFTRFILDHQNSLREQDLIAHANQLGLDAEKFAALIQQRHYAPRVDADLEAGAKRGIHGSPVIFINSFRFDGVPSLEKLMERIEFELMAKGKNDVRRP